MLLPCVCAEAAPCGPAAGSDCFSQHSLFDTAGSHFFSSNAAAVRMCRSCTLQACSKTGRTSCMGRPLCRTPVKAHMSTTYRWGMSTHEHARACAQA
eukprot:210448-Pelagomonas_calceolata.AAC.1